MRKRKENPQDELVIAFCDISRAHFHSPVRNRQHNERRRGCAVIYATTEQRLLALKSRVFISVSWSCLQWQCRPVVRLGRGSLEPFAWSKDGSYPVPHVCQGSCFYCFSLFPTRVLNTSVGGFLFGNHRDIERKENTYWWKEDMPGSAGRADGHLYE